jgi:hypothetical protein
MDFGSDRWGDIFDNDDGFVTASSITEVLAHLTEGMEAGKIEVPDALAALLNIVRPGSTEDSHDIRHHLMVAMIAQGFEAEARQIMGAYLTEFPWGIGLHLCIHRDGQHSSADDFTDQARAALIKSLRGCLCAGGINATINDDGTIHIGKGGVYSVDHQVEKFREELDRDLPSIDDDIEDGGEIADWMKRWIP